MLFQDTGTGFGIRTNRTDKIIISGDFRKGPKGNESQAHIQEYNKYIDA